MSYLSPFPKSITFFPLSLTPPMYASRHKINVIGFVINNHWVQVKLKLDYPSPPIIDRLRQNSTEDGKGWEVAYSRHLRH